MKKFGVILKELRKGKNLTGEELGNLLNVTKVAISNWENGNRTPDTEMLKKIADFFDVSVDYLIGRTDIKRFEDFPPEVKRVTELFAGLDAPKAERLEKLLRELLEK